jgi:hypothetical protein
MFCSDIRKLFWSGYTLAVFGGVFLGHVTGGVLRAHTVFDGGVQAHSGLEEMSDAEPTQELGPAFEGSIVIPVANQDED